MALKQFLAAVTLDRALSVQTENAEMPPVDPDVAGGDEKEAVFPVEDLELSVTSAKQLLTAGMKELLAAGASSSLRPAP